MNRLHSFFDNIKTHQYRAFVLTLFPLACLAVWYYMPIYPDEIALRFQLGRYIQDNGTVYGLYPLCSSNFKQTPFLFTAPAWFLSFADLHLTPGQLRIVPLVSTILVVWASANYSLRGRNPIASIFILTAFVGVAGSENTKFAMDQFYGGRSRCPQLVDRITG